jgi:hypothetical protein
MKYRYPISLNLAILIVYCDVFLVGVADSLVKTFGKSLGDKIESDCDDGKESEADHLNRNTGLSKLLSWRYSGCISGDHQDTYLYLLSWQDRSPSR